MGLRIWLMLFVGAQCLSVPAMTAPTAKSSAPAAKSTTKPLLKCGDEGDACCERNSCATIMLECVHGRCHESHEMRVLRKGGSHTDERGNTTTVEHSGDFELLTFSSAGGMTTATLYHHGSIVWSSDRGGPSRAPGHLPRTVEEAKRMYLSAEPRFDEAPLVRMNLVNVSFKEAAEFFMKLSHQQYDLSEPCGGKLTFVSDEELKPAEAFSAFSWAIGSFQLLTESPFQVGPTIHSGNVFGCACTLDENVVTRAFVLHHLTRTALESAPQPLARDFAGHMVSDRVFVATERPEVIRQMGFWLEKQDRLDESGKPVFLPDPIPRSKPYGVCPIAF